MPTFSEKSLEEAKRLLEDLRETKIPIIVEGRRDEKALRTLGVSAEIRRIQESGPVTETVWDLKRKGHKSAIILTDPDREGAKIARLAASALEDFGMHPVTGFRKMTRLFGKSAVEQLGRVAEEEEFG
jgi:5S rRNA maturation endonuclease (ribonuclease M5)